MSVDHSSCRADLVVGFRLGLVELLVVVVFMVVVESVVELVAA